MIIGLAYLLVLASVPLARGRLSALADLPLRRPWLVLAAIVIQILVISVLPAGDHTIHTTLHIASYFLLGAFAFANRHIVGVPIIALGGLLNFIAISANGGVMPADPDAIASLARSLPEGEFANSQVAPRREAPVPRRRLRHARLLAAAQRLQHRRRHPALRRLRARARRLRVAPGTAALLRHAATAVAA